MRAEVWVHTAARRVLCCEERGGVPNFACIDRATGTAGGYYVGHYALPDEGGWGKAGEIAASLASQLGFTVDYDAPSLGWIGKLP